MWQMASCLSMNGAFTKSGRLAVCQGTCPLLNFACIDSLLLNPCLGERVPFWSPTISMKASSCRVVGNLSVRQRNCVPVERVLFTGLFVHR